MNRSNNMTNPTGNFGQPDNPVLLLFFTLFSSTFFLYVSRTHGVPESVEVHSNGQLQSCF